MFSPFYAGNFKLVVGVSCDFGCHWPKRSFSHFLMAPLRRLLTSLGFTGYRLLYFPIPAIYFSFVYTPIVGLIPPACQDHLPISSLKNNPIFSIRCLFSLSIQLVFCLSTSIDAAAFRFFNIIYESFSDRVRCYLRQPIADFILRDIPLKRMNDFPIGINQKRLRNRINSIVFLDLPIGVKQNRK